VIERRTEGVRHTRVTITRLGVGNVRKIGVRQKCVAAERDCRVGAGVREGGSSHRDERMLAPGGA
jgi:hypothetical protein